MRDAATAAVFGSGNFQLSQRTILLPAEQGLGDTIQFVRYAPLLAQMGANVVLEVQPELKALLSTVSGVASCHARGETLPPFEVYCPLGSLPLALKTEPSSIPATIPYLRADDTRSRNGVRHSRRCPGNGSLWPGPVMHVMQMTVTGRSTSNCLGRCLRRKAFHS